MRAVSLWVRVRNMFRVRVRVRVRVRLRVRLSIIRVKARVRFKYLFDVVSYVTHESSQPMGKG
jgi:hypothetical protein